MLLVPRTTNSFISYRLAALAPIPASPLSEMWRVYYPSGDVEQIDWVYLNCEIFVEGFALTANLMLLEIVEFDVILGMDFLEDHRAIFDSHSKEVLFRSPCFVSAIKAGKMMNKGCEAFLTHVVNMNVEVPRCVP